MIYGDLDHLASLGDPARLGIERDHTIRSFMDHRIEPLGCHQDVNRVGEIGLGLQVVDEMGPGVQVLEDGRVPYQDGREPL